MSRDTGQRVIVSPQTALLLRDSRGFFAEAGQATGLPFPLPSVLAGSLRSACIRSSGHLEFPRKSDTSMRKIIDGWRCRGPILEIDTHPYLPAPADLLLPHADAGNVDPALSAPLQLATREGTNLPFNLSPLAPPPTKNRFPNQRYIPWRLFQNCLLGERPSQHFENLQASTFSPTESRRVHVSIERATRTAKDGALFGTTSYVYRSSAAEHHEDDDLEHQIEANIIAAFSIPAEGSLEGSHRMGNRGGFVHVEVDDRPPFPDCPEALLEELPGGRFKLVLVTPGEFEQGWIPDGFEENTSENKLVNTQLIPGNPVTMVAAALQRWQPVAGWDIQRGKPKRLRRLVPQGSVYYLQTEKPLSKSDIKILPWFHSLCNSETQAFRDGFGLAVFGRWDCSDFEKDSI